MKKEIEFNLKGGSLKYQPQGSSEFVIAKKLILKAPSVRQEKTADRLAQSLMQAFKSNMNISNVPRETNSVSNSKDKDITGSDVKTLLFMSSVNIADIKEAFRELLFDGACMIDGILKMQSHHYEEMDYDQVNDLMGEYISSFLLSSLLSTKK